MSQHPSPSTADIVLTSATVWDGKHLDGVDTIAIGDGRILAVGTESEISPLTSDTTTRIDVGQRRVIPGLIDSHIHMVRAGLRWNELVQWNEAGSMATALERLHDAATARDESEWIGVLGGWHPNQFDTARHPTMDELDEAAPNHPVYVQRGYTEGFVNSTALALLDLGDDVDRVTGRLTGPAAMGACNARLGLPDRESQVASTRSMLRAFNALGLTGAIDTGGFGMSPDLYEAITEVVTEGDRGFRTRMLVGPGSPGNELEQMERWMELVEPGHGDEFLRYIGAGEVLLFAAHDMEGIDGRDISAQTGALAHFIERLEGAGWPIHVHAILDSSVSTVLDAWERADSGGGLRSAITHAEQISPTNLQRIKDLGLGLTIQDGLAFRGRDSVPTWGAERVAQSPPLRDMLAADVPIAAGTDGSVASSYNPWVSLWWLVSGESVDGSPPRAADQRLTRDEALTMFTSGSAWFSNEEGTRGNLSPGSLADLVVLSSDFLSVPDRMITSIESELTIVGGEVVHRGQAMNGTV